MTIAQFRPSKPTPDPPKTSKKNAVEAWREEKVDFDCFLDFSDLKNLFGGSGVGDLKLRSGDFSGFQGFGL